MHKSFLFCIFAPQLRNKMENMNEIVSDMNRKVAVPEWLMHRITAMCDVAEDSQEPALSKMAKAIRKEIDKGLDWVKEDSK